MSKGVTAVVATYGVYCSFGISAQVWFEIFGIFSEDVLIDTLFGLINLFCYFVDCQFKCHMRCLEKITRQCAFVLVCETPFYSNDICPEVGLAAQGYRCHDCKSLIMFSEYLLKLPQTSAKKCLS